MVEPNPFYRDNESVSLTEDDIKDFTRVIVLCKKCNKIPSSFFKKKIDPNIIKNSIEFIPGPTSLLEGNHLKNAMIIEGSVLRKFHNLDYNDKEIVIFLLSLSYMNAMSYLSLYMENNSLQYVFEMLQIGEYYNTNSGKIREKIDQVFSTIESNNFSTNAITKLEFPSYNNKLFILSNLKNLEFSIEQLIMCNGYPRPITINYKNCIVTPRPIEITQDNMYKLLQMLENTGNKQFILSVSTLLLSTDSYTTLIKNDQIIEYLRPFMLKYMSIFNTVLSYTWTYFHINEVMTLREDLDSSNKFVFKINTANKLPFIPLCENSITSTPYLAYMSFTQTSEISRHLLGTIIVPDYPHYGIATKEEFVERIPWYFGSTALHDIWSTCAITGSIIGACAQKKNIIAHNCVKAEYNDMSSKLFKEFYSCYYNEPITVMIKANNTSDYINNFYSVIKKLYNNIEDDFDESDKIYHKELKIQVSKEKYKAYIEKMPFNPGNENNAINSKNFKEYLYSLYIHEKTIYNRDRDFLKLDDCKLASLEDIISIEFVSSVTDYPGNNFKIDETIFINETISYFVDFPESRVSLEFVHVNNYLAYVRDQPMPTMRGYYDGSEVYLLSTCISALMTGVNPDYKNPKGYNAMNYILNDLTRGYGTLLNSNERSYIISYVKGSDRWKHYIYDKPDNSLFNLKKLNNIWFSNSNYSGPLIPVNDSHSNRKRDLYKQFGDIYNTKMFSTFSINRGCGRLTPITKNNIEDEYNALYNRTENSIN